MGEFLDAIRAGALDRAVAAYGGTFLGGVFGGNAEFEGWRDEAAREFHRRYCRCLGALAAGAEAAADEAGAVRWHQLHVAAEPLSTPAILALMRALTRAGNRSGALQHSCAYAARMRAELDSAPDVAVLELAEKIREDTRGLAPDVAAEPVPEGLPERLTSSRRGVIAALVLFGLTGAILLRPSPPLNPEQVHLAPDRTLVRDSSLLLSLGRQLLRYDSAFQVVGRPASARYVVSLSQELGPDSVRLGATLDDASTHKRIGAVQLAFPHPFAPEVAGRALAERIGITLVAARSVELAGWASAAALPRSWVAFDELRKGIAAWGGREPGGPLAHFERAATLDSSSATSLVWKALVLSRGGRWKASDSALSGIQGGRRAGPWETAMMPVLRAWNRGDMAGAHAAGHRLLETVPNSEWAIVVAWDATGLGRQREALDLIERVPHTMPWLERWATVIRFQALHLSGDYGGELRVANEGLLKEPDSRWFRQVAVRALAGLGRTREVEQRCVESFQLTAQPQFEWQPCLQGIMELWGHGHVREAYVLADRVVRSTRPTVSALDRADLWTSVGDWDATARALSEVPDSLRNQAEYLHLFILTQAASGDRIGVNESRRRLDLLGALHDAAEPHGFSLREAELAALLGDRDEAVDWLAKAFQQGFRFRTHLHQSPFFVRLHGYQRFEDLKQPIDDPAHRRLAVKAP
ncbi:MAG TPA: bacterial transcriptional activator domain-containing protein [Gemmatimonadales bacterium]|nr:bacterial transcriptional activator domain-containing protein [Gemmatimonadales bacterium]